MAAGSGKRVVLGAALAALIPFCAVHAASTPLNATATFVSNLTLTATNDMQFGNISFNGSVGTSTVVLTTNGGITYNGAFSAGGASTIAAGTVAIGGTAGNMLDVSCDTSGTLAQVSGSGRIDVNTIMVAKESAAAGGGFACSGVGTAVLSFPLTAGTDDELKLGGTLDGSTQVSFGAGSYTTNTSGGTAINVDVVYQ